MAEASLGSRTSPDISDEPVASQRADLFKRLEKTPTCMLVTQDEAGLTHVRPMTTQRADDGGVIWMFIGADSHLAKEVAAHPGVLVIYADTGDSAYAAVRGHAATVRNREKAEELWTKLAEAWFPGGPEDPNLVLLRITMASAEHWEDPKGKVLQFLDIAAAAITHKPPAHDDVYRRLDF